MYTDLDDALKIIKEKSNAQIANNKSVFGEIDDDEEDEKLKKFVQHVPSGINLSGQNKREQFYRGSKTQRGFTSSSYISDENNTNHSRLHKPSSQYFGDKLQKLQKDEQDNKNKQLSDQELQIARNELNKIKELIILEKSKVKICMLCKRKFSNPNTMAQHEEKSETHKKLCGQFK
ncbi:hypothetical protein IMG5_182940 [Ichthyophthirius multifiliis]|uniref:Uncharacterized protein n=1 Tax=Ichthyophthirius multifiliis TaxID=5932 RepID=G0R333_ICHMU|nr:hypothetical protein IMG5_182940 [Ichthyophthirius multifiliis]EGR28109.1 hypothetical protein IMG5_182940 [Ichthyophthirius multifiliis]|eukprot:XP_004027454.1 hypothetical protein IMG5_182940 [Ichthyophthirius multifiliis]